MDEMKVKLADAVAAKLAAAPQSAAKDELLEELSDNLYRRFLDMTGAGRPGSRGRAAPRPGSGPRRRRDHRPERGPDPHHHQERQNRRYQ